MSYGDLQVAAQSSVRSVKTSFVGQVRRAMKDQGVSSAELARRLKCSRAHVTQTLRVNTNTTTRTMVEIADALGLEVHFTLKPHP